jgi:pimeloyl-ACP methyl ester carboxylesterase
VKTAHTPVLDIAYVENGPADGRPVVLMHGFPDDIHAYDRVVPPLTASGYRVIVPYLRGYGPTRFLDPATLRSGQQAALGHDLLDLIDVLDLKSPILAGYDWGGRAACIVAALWPERVGGRRRYCCRSAPRPRLDRQWDQFRGDRRQPAGPRTGVQADRPGRGLGQRQHTGAEGQRRRAGDGQLQRSEAD